MTVLKFKYKIEDLQRLHGSSFFKGRLLSEVTKGILITRTCYCGFK